MRLLFQPFQHGDGQDSSSDAIKSSKAFNLWRFIPPPGTGVPPIDYPGVQSICYNPLDEHQRLPLTRGQNTLSRVIAPTNSSNVVPPLPGLIKSQ